MKKSRASSSGERGGERNEFAVELGLATWVFCGVVKGGTEFALGLDLGMGMGCIEMIFEKRMSTE